MFKDPIVEEVRAARQRHSARFGHDLNAIVADFKERQKHLDRPLVSLSPKKSVQKASWHKATITLDDSTFPIVDHYRREAGCRVRLIRGQCSALSLTSRICLSSDPTWLRVRDANIGKGARHE